MNNGPPASEPLYDGHRALWIQEYDPKTKTMIGPRTMIVNGGVDLSKKPIWIEGPHIFRKDGSYYLIAAEGGTAEEHSEVVFRSKSVLGPWEPYSGNPILTQRHLNPARAFPITSAGHADFVETQNGEWWAVFLGARPYKENFYNTGRETFMLPVRWVDGWPRILDGDATIPYAVKRPNLPWQPNAHALKTGNFTERDDFAESKLPLYWTFMRTIREPWFELASKPGWLTISARPADIGKRTQPSFIGRRQQHAFATVSTALQFTPAGDGDRSGLAAFQGDDNYFLLVVTRAQGKPVIRLEQSSGRGATRVLASAPLIAQPGATVFLQIRARGDKYDFAYSLAAGRWTTLIDGVDGTFLSTKAAGGFVGSMFGMYAYQNY
jgi:alpha-N-arabinofuranosidase